MEFQLDTFLKIQRDLAVQLSGISDLEEIYKVCLETILGFSQFDGGSIYSVDHPGKYNLVYQINIAKDILARHEAIPRSDMAMKGIMGGEPLYKETLQESGPNVEDFQSMAILPIMHQNAIVSLVHLVSRKSPMIPGEIRKSLEIVAVQMGSAIVRAKAEKAHIESEEKFRNISEEITDGVAVVVDNKHVWVNAAFCKIFGYTREELIGKGPEMTVAPEDIPKVLESAKRGLSGEQIPSRLEIKGIRKDKSLVDLEVTGKVIRYNNAPAIQLVVHDIGDRKKVEEELRSSEEKYRLISENSNDIIMVIDEKLQIYYVNENALLKWLGYDAQTIGAKPIKELIHPEDFPDAMAKIRQGFAEIGTFKHKELRFLNNKNVYIWFDVEGLAYIDPKGSKRLLVIARDIQAKKEQEIQLMQSEEKYRLIAENSSDLIFLYDKNLNILYGNEQVLGKKLGWMLEEYRKMKLNDIVHMEDIISLLSAFNYVKTHPITNQQREIRLRNKLGQYRWFNAECSSYTDPTGQLRILFIGRDIHDRKLQALRLKESEERYRLISENASDIIFVLDKNLDTVYCNERALLKKLGYLSSEFTKFPTKEHIHAEDFDAAIDTIKELLKKPGTLAKREIRVKHKNSRYIWLDIEATAYIDEKMELKLLLVARDVQEKKESELKLVESLERFKIIAENIQDGITIINQKGEMEYINDAVKSFGLDPNNLTGKNATFLMQPEDLQRTVSLLQECFQKGKAMGVFRVMNPVTRETRWYETVGNSFHDKDGNIRVLTISHDISGRQKIQDLLESENKLLKEIDEMRKDFVLNATHELKTPLSIIIGAADFLSKYYSEIPEQKRMEFLNSIRKGSIRLKQLIENLLDYSRLESGRLQLQQLEETDLVELVHNSVQNLSYLINRRQQEIILNLPKLIMANVDKFRIEQVIVNMISNAVKNTQPGGKIVIDLESISDQVQFAVKDNGVGLTREEMTRLFKKFSKIERAGVNADIDIQGTGLGLFIAKEIIEMHGGKIWAESEGRNKGSRFIFTVPVSGLAKPRNTDSNPAEE